MRREINKFACRRRETNEKSQSQRISTVHELLRRHKKTARVQVHTVNGHKNINRQSSNEQKSSAPNVTADEIYRLCAGRHVSTDCPVLTNKDLELAHRARRERKSSGITVARTTIATRMKQRSLIITSAVMSMKTRFSSIPTRIITRGGSSLEPETTLQAKVPREENMHNNTITEDHITPIDKKVPLRLPARWTQDKHMMDNEIRTTYIWNSHQSTHTMEDEPHSK